jgi:Protein of unknown function (DUF732)
MKKALAYAGVFGLMLVGSGCGRTTTESAVKGPTPTPTVTQTQTVPGPTVTATPAPAPAPTPMSGGVGTPRTAVASDGLSGPENEQIFDDTVTSLGVTVANGHTIAWTACDRLDANIKEADFLDEITSGLHTDSITAVTAIGAGVSTYCPQHNNDTDDYINGK